MTNMLNEQTTQGDRAALVRDTFTTIFGGGYTTIDEHPGLAMLRQAIPALRAAFPDFSAELKQQLVEGNRVASHWIFRGTHLGALYGIAPTGRSAQFQNLSICRIENGRIVQYNSEVGFLSLFRQLGVPPFAPTK